MTANFRLERFNVFRDSWEVVSTDAEEISNEYHHRKVYVLLDRSIDNRIRSGLPESSTIRKEYGIEYRHCYLAQIKDLVDLTNAEDSYLFDPIMNIFLRSVCHNYESQINNVWSNDYRCIIWRSK